MKLINVSIGDYHVAGGHTVLTTVLGSCVGVIIYDKVNKVGGLAHVYLPDSRLIRRKVNEDRNGSLSNVLKYADLLIPRMIKKIEHMHGEKKHFFASIVGGASIYDFPSDSLLNVGRRNLETTREILDSLDIRYVEVKVGGRHGRRVTFHLDTGDIEIIEFKDSV